MNMPQPLPNARTPSTPPLPAGLLLVSLLLLTGAAAHAQLAAGQDKFFGCLLEGRPGKEKPVPDTWHDLFNQVSPENAGKWGRVEPVRDSMDFSVLDEQYAYAQDRGLPFLLHSITRLEQEPPWLRHLPPEEIVEEFEEWIAALAERYPDTDLIDVVNEAPHGKLGSLPFKQALGGTGETGWDNVREAYRLTRRYFPNAKLLLNDYSVLERSSARNYDACARVLYEDGVLDGLGCQGHFLEFGRSPAHINGRLDALTANVPLPVYITEFELAIADDAEQLRRYQEVFGTLWEHPAVQGVTLWGYERGKLWRDDGWLYEDSTGRERPALQWLRDYLRVDNRTMDTLQAEVADSRFGFGDWRDTAAATRVADLTKDSTFLGWRYVEMDSFDVAIVRHRSTGAGQELRLRFGASDGEMVASVTLPEDMTAGAYRTDTIVLPTAYTGVRDVFLERRGGDPASASFEVDYVAFAKTTRPVSNLRELGAEDFTVWPSPAGATLNVRVTESARANVYDVSVYDVSGREVLALGAVPAGGAVTADVSALATGTYVVRVVGGGSVGVRRVVLQ